MPKATNPEFRPNKFPASCVYCREEVEAGKGHIWFHKSAGYAKGRYYVAHQKCQLAKWAENEAKRAAEAPAESEAPAKVEAPKSTPKREAKPAPRRERKETPAKVEAKGELALSAVERQQASALLLILSGADGATREAVLRGQKPAVRSAVEAALAATESGS